MTILIALINLKIIALFFNTVVSVSVSVSAKRETFFRFRYRFRPKRKMAVSAIFGFGRNEKKPFGCTLLMLNILTRHLVAYPYVLTNT